MRRLGDPAPEKLKRTFRDKGLRNKTQELGKAWKKNREKEASGVCFKESEALINGQRKYTWKTRNALKKKEVSQAMRRGFGQGTREKNRWKRGKKK